LSPVAWMERSEIRDCPGMYRISLRSIQATILRSYSDSVDRGSQILKPNQYAANHKRKRYIYAGRLIAVCKKKETAGLCTLHTQTGQAG
jgi:hypothetical protein